MHFGLKWIVAANIIFLTVIRFSVMQATSRPRPDYQNVADSAAWVWHDEQANPLWCMRQNRGPYGIELVDDGGSDNWILSIRFVRDGTTVFTYTGHYRTVFMLANDDLYIAEFGPITSGCSVVAIQLPDGRERWRTQLRGLGPVSHSRYSNQINLSADNECITVRGNESAGQYIEFLDLATGKTVGHHVFAKGATNKTQ